MSHRNDCKYASLVSLGYSGHINDMWSDWLTAAGFDGPIDDAEFAWLGSLGYTGHINDRWYNYLLDVGAPPGALPDMLDWLWCVNGGPTGIEVLLDATFHRYGPAGPVALVDGDILDDTGTEKGQIDLGKLTCYFPQGNTATLQNEMIEYESAPFGDSVYFGTIELVRGLTAYLKTGPNNNRDHAIIMSNLIASMSAIQGQTRAGMFAQRPFHENWYQGPIRPIEATEIRAIWGGYTVDGEPDPDGAYGGLSLLNGELYLSWPADINQAPGTDVYVGFCEYNAASELDEAKIYIDPSPLATVVRSLFATDHASIEDYTPEQGAAWVNAQNDGWITTAGAAQPSNSANNAATQEVGAPIKYLEFFLRQLNGDQRVGLRAVDADNYFAVHGSSNAQTLILVEVIAGQLFQRGTISGSWNAGQPEHVIMIDADGTDITVEHPLSEQYLTYATTVQAAATKAILSGSWAAGGVRWLCVRATR